MSTPKLAVLVASTRPGRIGLPIAHWVLSRAVADPRFDAHLLDLAAWDLPFHDEPKHPRLRQYEKDHTKRWSAHVDGCDAFVFVQPEYNHGMAAPLKNALDYLLQEWQYKPVAFVSYGGMSGGLRAVQMTKPIVAAMKMVPIVEAVGLPFAKSQLSADGSRFDATESQEKSAAEMLTELHKWTIALRGLRSP